ncbi:MAG: YceI family protein [Sphingobacteriales bacterium]|nr:YceI family protein [Sphingobacteriales bacterium]
MKKSIVILLLSVISITAGAQSLYMTKVGKVSFNSRSSVEKIEADNNEVSSVINTQTGDMVFAILLKSFHFDRALMEEHFNENYVESDKFPKSTFKGKISNLSAINFTKDGNYPAVVEGDLTMHGVTKKVSSNGTLTVKAGKIAAYAKFSVKLKDFDISIPSLVADKISQDIDIIVDCKYDPKS